MTSRVYAIQYLRPDGWWEAGRGWSDKYAAERDASDQLPKQVKWRVVVVGGEKHRETVSSDDDREQLS